MSGATSGDGGGFRSSATQSDTFVQRRAVLGMHTANVARISSGTVVQAARQLESAAASTHVSACALLQRDWHSVTAFAEPAVPDDEAPDDDPPDDDPPDDDPPDDEDPLEEPDAPPLEEPSSVV